MAHGRALADAGLSHVPDFHDPTARVFLNEKGKRSLAKTETLDGTEGSRLAHYIDRAVESKQCFIALDDSKPVGYAVLSYQFYDNGWVDMLYVGRDSRRRGVGITLLAHLTQNCTTPKLFASTNQSNKPMQALLVKAGFEPSGVIHNLDAGDPELAYFKLVDRDPCRPTRQIDPGPSVRLIRRAYLGQHFAHMGRSFIEKYFSRIGARDSEHDM